MKAHSVAALARGLIMINPTHCSIISVVGVVLNYMFFTIGSGLSCELKVAFFPRTVYGIRNVIIYHVFQTLRALKKRIRIQNGFRT